MIIFSDLKDLPAKSPGVDSLTCEYSGTKEGSFKWYTATDTEVTEGGDSPYTIEAGTWSTSAKTISEVLKIDSSKVSGTPSITCAVDFTDNTITLDLKTSTLVSYIAYSK